MGSGSNKAQREAQQAEQQRQAQIAGTVGQINRIYDSPQREAQIQDFVSAMRDYYGQDLDRQKAQNDRALKFSLARGGLIGGSTQVDQSRRLGEDYQRGVLSADRQAQGAGAQLRAQDQSSKMNLIAMAQSGLDATTAAQQAAASMRSALDSQMATSRAQGLGDMFGDLAKVYDQSQQAAERRRQDRLYGSLYPQTYMFGAPQGQNTPFYQLGKG